MRVGSSRKEASCRTRSMRAARSSRARGPPRARARLARDRERVYGEVAPAQVVGDARAQRHLGQRARARIALGPRAREVDLRARSGQAHLGGAEALVLGDDLAQLARDGQRVALDDDVEVADRLAQQRVADRAAHQPQPAAMGAQLVPAGDVAEAVEQHRPSILTDAQALSSLPTRRDQRLQPGRHVLGPVLDAHAATTGPQHVGEGVAGDWRWACRPASAWRSRRRAARPGRGASGPPTGALRRRGDG